MTRQTQLLCGALQVLGATSSGALAVAIPTGPANAPAPMFGLNIANTGQSIEYGPTAKPQVAWTRQLGQYTNFDYFTYAPQSLALSSDGLLYTPGLYALHAGDGSIAWQSPTGWRDSHAALDAQGRVFATENAYTYGRDAASGAQLWKGAFTNASDGDPTKIGPDGTIYSSTFNGNVYAFTPAGQLKWQALTGSPQYGEISHIPAIDASNNIYYAGASGLRSLDFDGQTRWSVAYSPQRSSVVMLAPSGAVVWQRDDLVEARNPTTGALVAQFAQTDILQAMDSQGNLYFVGNNDVRKTTAAGQTLWQYTRQWMDWPLTIDAADNVYCGTQQGDLVALSSGGSELWEIHLTDNYPALFNTAPVLGPSGDIYVLELSDQRVIALTAVPEPTSSLALLGVASVYICRRRRARR